MNFISGLEKLSPPKVALYSGAVLTLICPGYLFLFLYHRTLFLSLDITRLLILSISISMPFFVANSIVGLAGCLSSQPQGDKMNSDILLGRTAFSGIVFTTVVFCAIFGFFSLPFKSQYDVKLSLIFTQLIFFVGAMLNEIRIFLWEWLRPKLSKIRQKKVNS